MKAIILITGMTLSLCLNTACAESVSEPAEAAAVNPAPTAPAASVPDATPPEEKSQGDYSDGMRIPVDGTSLESFNESLESIKTKSTEAEYTTLTGAIDYLMVYDLGARRDRARLAQRLDGLTGEQIVDKVNWNKGTKTTRKPRQKKPVSDDQ